MKLVAKVVGRARGLWWRRDCYAPENVKGDSILTITDPDS